MKSVVDQKQRVKSKETKNEELVKCMSKLPTYLERGENPQDKVLNVGVLDWHRLEKWQCTQKHIFNGRSKFSASSSDSSSFFSTDLSSNSSSRGQARSPARQKSRRPTLLCHLNASPNEANPQNAACKWKNSDPQSVAETINVKDSRVSSSLKGKTKIQEGESIKEPKKLQEVYCNIIRDESDETRKNVVLLLPRNGEMNGRNSRESSHSKLYYEIPHSGPLPCEVERAPHSKIKEPGFIDTAKVSTSSLRNKIAEEKKVIGMQLNSTSIESSKGLDRKMVTSAANKVRNPSPTRRLIAGLSWIGRNSSTKDSGAVAQLSSSQVPAKNGGNPSKISARLDFSARDNSNMTTSRAHSSPLRRLLDPLLKPKVVISHQVVEASNKDPTTTVRACKSSDSRDRSWTLTSCRKTDINEAKNGPSTVQALLQISTKKNGLPIFTFALENSSNVLAATVRKLSDNGKGGPTWIYTFFTVRKMKKKNGSWLNQGGKVQGDDYVPNVVAQMKVSEQFAAREFVLFATDLGRLNQQTSAVEPNDELAAIVVKFPRTAARGVKRESGLSGGNTGDFSSTVILPGGNHGVPEKGEPSPLIERWKTGGLCDCGGWDLGCRVRVLANRSWPSEPSSSTNGQLPTARFELFSEGEVLTEKPVFSLSSFKNGIFSAEFNSALSFVQAFSICIAVSDSNKQFELSESSNS